jgi:hypothetical protein
MNPHHIEVPFIKSEFLVEKPKYTSILQRAEDDKKFVRKRAGLSEVHIDIKNTNKDPTINYIPKPKAPSKTLLEA